MSELWPLKPLGELCTIVNGGTPKSKVSEYWGGDVNWITPAEMGKMTTPYIGTTNRKITELGLQKSSAKLFPPHSVILSTRAPIGHLAINTSPMSTNQGCKTLIPNDELNHKYLYYFLYFNKELLDSLGTGATFKELSGKNLKEVMIPVPSIKEQQRIVNILDEAFKNIKSSIIQVKYKEKSAIELSKSSLTSVFRELNVQIKVKIGEFCKTTSGSTPRKSNKDYHTNGTIPWLLSGEVNTKEINESKNFITELALKETSVKLFPPDSVLVAMYGATAGQVGILRFPSTTNQAICGIFPNDKILPEYLYYVLQNANAELVAQASGSAQPNLSQQKIKALSIPLPSLNEQSEIIQQLEFLSQNINQIKHICLQELDSYNELRRSLLQEAFSGKLTGGIAA